MIEALSAFVFWRKERRKETLPVPMERRKIGPRKAQEQLLESVHKFSEAVKRAADDASK